MRSRPDLVAFSPDAYDIHASGEFLFVIPGAEAEAGCPVQLSISAAASDTAPDHRETALWSERASDRILQSNRRP